VLLRHRNSDDWIDCSKGAAVSVPGDPAGIAELRSGGARYILVVEKQGVFARLVEERIWRTLPVVIMCGLGIPDMASRALTQRLTALLRVPVVGLFDYGPGGVRVWAVWRRGSARSGLDAWRFALPVAWLGLRWADVAALSLPAAAFQGLTARDRRALQIMQRWQFIQQRPEYAAELQRMLDGAGKLELEALNHHGFRFTAQWVVRKVLQREYL